MNQILTIILFISACTQGTTSSTKSMAQDWQIEVADSYEGVEYVTIKFINTSNTPLRIIDPFNKKVEQQIDGQWETLNLRYCLCGSCPPPPSEIDIPSGKEYSFYWDKKVVTCEGDRKVQHDIANGTFKATIDYLKEEEFNQLSVQFIF